MFAVSWIVQIFNVSDAQCQANIAGLLGSMGVDFSTPTKGPDTYVIAECADREQAHRVSAQVLSVDLGAFLVQETGPGCELDGVL